MAKGKGKPKYGKTPILGGKKDGARKSQKGQTTAKLAANRTAKMEKRNPTC